MYRASIFITLYLLAILHGAAAQNLVRNGSFERYLECPQFNAQFHLAEGWFNPSTATPDFFHVCNNSEGGMVGVPEHPGGFQYPHSGDGYIAILLSSWPEGHPQKDNYREYLGTRLAQKMIKGQTYCVSLHVAVNRLTKFSTDQLSIYFSTDSVYQHHPGALFKITPQLDNEPGKYLDDTTGWTKINWVYTATDTFEWMTVGNFREPKHTGVRTLRNIPDEDCLMSYYYIDDISILPQPADTGWLPEQLMPCGAPVTVSGGDFETYLWSTGETTKDITISAPGQYWLETTTACGMHTDSFVARTIDTTTVKFTVNDGTFSCQKALSVTLPSYNTYLWSTGSNTPSIDIKTAGVYWAEVSNTCGTYRDSFIVKDGGCFFMPDAFSPNKDGLNDILKPRGIINSDGYSFNLYNRWGQKVFSTTDINTGWNGMHQASLADLGTYHWYIRYRNEENAEIFLEGNVTLLR